MNHPTYSNYTFRRGFGHDLWGAPRHRDNIERGGADTLDEALRLAHRRGYASPGERIEVRGPTNATEVTEVAVRHPTKDDEIVWSRG